MKQSSSWAVADASSGQHPAVAEFSIFRGLAEIEFFKSSDFKKELSPHPEVVAGVETGVFGIWIVEIGCHVYHDLSRFAENVLLRGCQDLT